MTQLTLLIALLVYVILLVVVPALAAQAVI